MSDLKLEKLAPNHGHWEFLSATADGEGSNVLTARYLTCEADVIWKLLVIRFPRRSHIVSKSVYRSLPDLDIANMSRLAHVLDVKSLDSIYQHVVKMFEDAVIAYGHLDVCTCLSLWADFSSMIRGYRGPFTKKDRRGGVASLVLIVVLCFPNGPPAPSTNWQISSEATIPLAQGLLRGLSEDIAPIHVCPDGIQSRLSPCTEWGWLCAS